MTLASFRLAMSRRIEEIMNRELVAVLLETPAEAIRELLRRFEIEAVPVLDEGRHPLGVVTARALLGGSDGIAADHMSRPATCIEASTEIEEAMGRIALADVHRLVVVDSAARAVGMVSEVDVLRAMLGMPAHHPPAFPHWDAATQSSWTDEWPLDVAHATHAPDAAGVLVLVRNLVGETAAVVWAEECANVRERVRALTALGASAEPRLARLLERHDLCFRAAAVPKAADRERIASGLRSDLEHRPPPGGT